MLMEHVGQHALDGVVAAAQIHIEDALPGFGGDVLKLLLLCNARVVDKQGHGAKLGLSVPDHLPQGFHVGHIRLTPDGLKAL